jgi:hypothetical protein
VVYNHPLLYPTEYYLFKNEITCFKTPCSYLALLLWKASNRSFHFLLQGTLNTSSIARAFLETNGRHHNTANSIPEEEEPPARQTPPLCRRHDTPRRLYDCHHATSSRGRLVPIATTTLFAKPIPSTPTSSHSTGHFGTPTLASVSNVTFANCRLGLRLE